MQGGDKEGQNPLPVESIKESQGQQAGFYKYFISKRNTRENVGSLLNQIGVLVKEDREEAELLNTFFPSVLTAEADSGALRNPRPWGKERKAGERRLSPGH